MANKIKNIRAEIQTATQERGDRTYNNIQVPVQNDSRVYLGVAGREFACATERADFQAGAIDTFIFGGDANVEHANINDPQTLALDDVLAFPVYIRFEPHPYDQDNWCVERVEVTIEDDQNSIKLSSKVLDGEATVWLGLTSGEILYLSQ
jgi:hypothetical protein